MAARARRLARGLVFERDVKQLVALAEEMEARAAALEAAPKTVSHSEAVAMQRSDPDAGQSG